MKRLGSFVATTAIALGIIIVLVVGVAFGYSWYMSQQSPVATTTSDTSPPASVKTPAPTPPTPGTSVGASVQSFVESAVRGEKVSLTVKTTATADCMATVRYGEDKAADRPLGSQTADEYGLATWQWTILGNVPKGKWPITVSCVYGKKSAMVKPDLIIK